MNPDERRSISIAFESRSEGIPAVRLERCSGLPPGAVWIRLEPEAVTVTCGPAAVVEGPGLDVQGAPGGPLCLREGPLAVRIEGGDARLGDGEAPWGESGRDRVRLLPPAPRTSARNTIPAGEWQVVDAAEPVATTVPLDLGATRTRVAPVGPPSSRRGPIDFGHTTGDAPTRIERMEEVLARSPAARPPQPRPPGAPFEPWAASTAPPTAPAPRIRVGVRRFALVAMLAASFMLWLHAQRVRGSSGAHRARTTPAVAAAPSGSTRADATASTLPAADTSAVGSPAVGPTAPESVEASALPTSEARRTFAPSPPAHRMPSQARVAVDALVNGDYPNALKLYDELAAAPDRNLAYAQVARSLRSRLKATPR